MGRPTVAHEQDTPDELSSEDPGASLVVLAALDDEGEARSGKALQRDAAGPRADVDLALHEPTAREVASAYLRGLVRVGTRTDPPDGRRTIDRALAANPTGQPARERPAERHDDAVVRIRDRMQRAREEGDLPADVDPGVLARHLVTVSSGISVQADDGVGADELHQVVAVALQVWPPTAAARPRRENDQETEQMR